MEKEKTINLKEVINYSDDGIVSKIVSKKEAGNVTLFAFDKGQALSEHTAPFDAQVLCIEGSVEVIINGVAYNLSENDTIIMPANIPHAINAKEKFKMLLIMIKN